MKITKVSDATGIVHTREIDISEWGYARYKRGELGYVQEAFPHLSANDREFLLTGITPEEWDELMGDLEEDEDDNYTGYGA